MGRFDGYLICSDIDGTLVDAAGRVPPANEEAICRFQREGGLFTVSTGRYPQYAQRFGDRLRCNTLLICINGTCLYDTDTQCVVYSHPMDNDVLAVLRWVERSCPCVNGIYLGIGLRGETAYPRTETGFHLPEHCSEPIYKAVLTMPAAAGDAFKAQMLARFGDRYAMERSWAEGLELHARGSGKGDAVRQLRRLLPSVHTVVAVGDYENDLTMLEAADIGYAVANAIPSVKEAADRLTVSHNEGALAHIIDDLARTV